MTKQTSNIVGWTVIATGVVAALLVGGFRYKWGSPWAWSTYPLLWLFVWMVLSAPVIKALGKVNAANLGQDLDAIKKNTAPKLLLN